MSSSDAAKNLKYLEDVAGLFCRKRLKSPPAVEEGCRLIRGDKKMTEGHLDWYKRAAQDADFEETMSTKMLDLRAFNPA